MHLVAGIFIAGNFIDSMTKSFHNFTPGLHKQVDFKFNLLSCAPVLQLSLKI